jgi:predicted O-linked N-acetylglucosamine transferase (SPINDLY family)
MPARDLSDGLAGHVRGLLTLHAAGRLRELEQGARAASRRFPRAPILRELLGIALCGQERHGEALPLLEEAARAQPEDALFWENLGLCQRRLGDYEQAARSLERSLALRPRSVEALNALASTLRSLGREAQARSRLEEALTLAPDHVLARVNLARLLAGERRLAEADAHLSHAMETARRAGSEINAENVAFWELAASVAGDLGRHAEANELHRAICRFALTPARAVAAILPARRMCDWEQLGRLEQLACEAARADAAEVAPGFATFLYLASAGPQDQLATARLHAAAIAAARGAAVRRAARPRSDRLRIGYLSNDFCNHPVGHVLAAVIEAHDRGRFDVWAFDYSAPSAADALHARFQRSFDRMVSIHGLSDGGAAQLIADSAVDIVIDLKGWTTGERAGVLAPRPAPLQMQWLGYPGTMGAAWIDYIIADPVLVPNGSERHFTEKVLRLPVSAMPCERRSSHTVPARVDCGLPQDAFVFCSFNQALKITPEIFAVWMRLLAAVDGALLWLPKGSAEAMRALEVHAEAHGIARSRLVFAPFVPRRDDHLARLSCADVALDCFPYGSHVTACDALAVGVPLIALQGETLASRVSSSVLAAAGLTELVAASPEEYFEVALTLAHDPARLAVLRTRLRQNEWLDAGQFARHLEAGFCAVWERLAAGLPAGHVAVA